MNNSDLETKLKLHEINSVPKAGFTDRVMNAIAEVEPKPKNKLYLSSLKFAYPLLTGVALLLLGVYVLLPLSTKNNNSNTDQASIIDKPVILPEGEQIQEQIALSEVPEEQEVAVASKQVSDEVESVGREITEIEKDMDYVDDVLSDAELID